MVIIDTVVRRSIFRLDWSERRLLNACWLAWLRSRGQKVD
jgi:hypothetical protein